jgi:hypothetical protein
MPNMKNKYSCFAALIIALLAMLSCQKEIDGSIDQGIVVNPTNLEPRVGTTWTYFYYWVTHQGGPTHAKTVKYKAASDTTISGEKYLRIIDMENDTLVYYMTRKVDGLYQFTNNASYILCKHPAAVGDTYTTFNDGATEDFTVRGVNDSTSTGIGNIPLSKYEGVKTGYIIDVLWYNKNAWIVWKNQYKKNVFPMGIEYYLFSRMFIDRIVY